MIQRPELQMLKENGYVFDDPFDVISMFEKKIADYTGAPYVTVTDCCTHALELCLRYKQLIGEKIPKLKIPAYTYISVPMMIRKVGEEFEWHKDLWNGFYYLAPTNIIDMAVRFTKDCYIPKTECCLSFQNKKVLKINRGGAILTDNKQAHDYYQLASRDGRNFKFKPWATQQNFNTLGYHYNLTSEDCARGILLMDELSQHGPNNPDAFDDCKKYYADMSLLDLTF